MVRRVVLGIAASALTVWLIAACNRGSSGGGGASTAGDHAFELECAGSATDTSGTMYCVRTDTRSGDVLRVDINKLPVSNGPVGAAAGPAGRYRTSCVAINMAERSDFTCVRLNTESGEMLLVNLLKVDAMPK
jgi:hypothetical protein